MATTGASLDSIYSRLSSAPEYHPFNADTFSDWSMEAGDMIRVSRDGNNYDSPVHNATTSWKGQSQISVSSDGNEKRESISKATKKKYSRSGSGYRNDSILQREIRDSYNGLSGFFEVTASRMYAEFKGDYDGLAGLFEVTRSRMGAEFLDAYNKLAGAFEVTAGHMAAAFLDSYNGLAGAFEVTASQMAADFSGAYDGLVGHFEVTRSQMAADFYGAYDGLKGSFNVTRSQMAADFSSAYDGLVGHFETTRSLFNVALQDSYQQLTSGFQAAANYSMMYSEGYVDGKITRANILTLINTKTGQAEAYIDADNILIGTGTQNAKVNLANVISLGDNTTVLIKKDVVVNETYGANGVKLSTDGTIRGHNLTLIKTGGQEGEYEVESITSDDIDEMVVKAQLDGNTLRLWTRGADLSQTSGDGIINFSKATSLSGSWGSGEEGEEPLGKFTVTATQNGAEVGSVFTNITYAPGQVTWSATKATIPLYATVGESQATYFVRNVEINAPTVSAPTFALTGTNAGNTNSASATSSNGRGGSPVYTYLVVGDINTSTQKIPVTLKVSETSALDAKDNGTRVAYAEVKAPYSVTDGSIVPVNFENPPSGWTKHEFTASGSKYQYHTKNGTSGSGTNVLVYFIPRLTVDGSVLNPGTTIYRSNSTIPTQIWHDAYNNGWDDVVLNDPDWQYPAANHNSDNTTAANSVVIAASNKTDGTTRSKTIPIALTVDTTNKKAKVSAGSYVRAIENIDMKTNAEYNTAVANAGYAGRAAVTIDSTLTWGTAPASGISATQNSFTVKTAGRTDSNGTIHQDEETFDLYSQVSTSGLDATFYVTIGDSADGSRVIKRTATCTVPNTYILKTSVSAGISNISWDSTNKNFYGYGYAYAGSSSPQDTTSKKTSSQLSIGDDSWSNGTKKVWVKHGSSEILSDTVSIPAVDATVWENTSGNYWRTRLTIGGVYRYSSTKEFAPTGYTQEQYDQNFLDGYNYDPHDLGIYDVNSVQATNVTVEAEGSVDLWPGFPKYQASGTVWGTKCTVNGPHVSAPENSSYYIANSAPGNSISSFISGATRLFSNGWVASGYYYKFKIGKNSYYFKAG